jgi:hypothetical protein
VARGGPSRAWQCGHRLSHRRYMLPVPARHHWRCSACALAYCWLAARRGARRGAAAPPRGAARAWRPARLRCCLLLLLAEYKQYVSYDDY